MMGRIRIFLDSWIQNRILVESRIDSDNRKGTKLYHAYIFQGQKNLEG